MRLPDSPFLRIFSLFTLAVIGLAMRNDAFGATERVLWSFGSGTDGAEPIAGLTMDAKGDLYGTTDTGGAYGAPNGLGTVFELMPPSIVDGNNWSESILWSFGNGTDGAFPWAGVAKDRNGNLYGTTSEGGDAVHAQGTVFELTPPSSMGSNWNESILWSFGDANPLGGLNVGANGNLYGTTSRGGARLAGEVFKLTPTATGSLPWNRIVLHALCSLKHCVDGQYSYSGLIMDESGNLYGTVVAGGAYGRRGSFPYGYGTAFKLSSTGGGFTVLWNFGRYPHDGYWPQAGLIIDAKGNLYGTTVYGGAYGSFYSGGGTVSKLTPGGKQSILWSFGNGTDGAEPLAGLIMDGHGNLYGTTTRGGPYGGGTAFELSPPFTSSGTWTESILWTFGNGTDGATPYSSLTMDRLGDLYGTTIAGGAYGLGTVFKISTSAPGRP